jgi:hypothetical protein
MKPNSLISKPFHLSRQARGPAASTSIAAPGHLRSCAQALPSMPYLELLGRQLLLVMGWDEKWRMKTGGGAQAVDSAWFPERANAQGVAREYETRNQRRSIKNQSDLTNRSIRSRPFSIVSMLVA